MTWLIALFDKRLPDGLPNRCVNSDLHSEKTSHLFEDCQGHNAGKNVQRGCTPMLHKRCFLTNSNFKSSISFLS